MAACAKPEIAKMNVMMQIAKDNKAKMIKLERKERPFMTHIRTLEESANLFAWFMLVDCKKDDFNEKLGEWFGGLDFMGMKFENKDDKAWFKAFRAVHQDFFKFIKGNYPDALQWTGKSTDIEG